MQYEYRKMFGMTQEEMDNEPLDTFFLNLKISELINKFTEDEIKRNKMRNARH